MNVMTMLIEELALSGSVSFPQLAESTVKRKTRELNQQLEAGNYGWRVTCDAKTRTISVTKKPEPGVLTMKQQHAFAEEIIGYLTKKEMFYSVNIWAAGKWYSDSPDHDKGTFTKQVTKNGSEYYVSDYDGPCPCEYNNPDTLTMTFEGPLYREMNYGDWDRGAWADLNRIGKKYGLYHEMGHAWSLAFYA